jgi:hypothetical protein
LPTSATNARYAEFAVARASLFSRDAAALIFIALCWIAAILLVNPIGEFPCVDDWAYLKSVRALVERGEIVLSDWSAPNLIVCNSLCSECWPSFLCIIPRSRRTRAPPSPRRSAIRQTVFNKACEGHFPNRGQSRALAEPPFSPRKGAAPLATPRAVGNPAFFMRGTRPSNSTRSLS